MAKRAQKATWQKKQWKRKTISSRIAMGQNSIDLLKRSFIHYTMPLADKEGYLFIPCLFEWYRVLKCDVTKILFLEYFNFDSGF